MNNKDIIQIHDALKRMTSKNFGLAIYSDDLDGRWHTRTTIGIEVLSKSGGLSSGLVLLFNKEGRVDGVASVIRFVNKETYVGSLLHPPVGRFPSFLISP